MSTLQLKCLSFLPKDVDNQFMVQIFGLDETGKEYSVWVDGYRPHFYIEIVGGKWKSTDLHCVEEVLTECTITKLEFVYKKGLYGYEGDDVKQFVYIEFANLYSFKMAKYKWMDKQKVKQLVINRTKTIVYESNIPPLLRLFHIHKISPSGWIEVNLDMATSDVPVETNCAMSISVNIQHIKPIPKESAVPYKIMSFDIEANSSHGDFPLPIKSYRKLANDILNLPTYVELKQCIHTAFQFDTVAGINIVYPKQPITLSAINKCIHSILSHTIDGDTKRESTIGIEDYFIKINKLIDDDDEEEGEANEVEGNEVEGEANANEVGVGVGEETFGKNIEDVLKSNSIPRDVKVLQLNDILSQYLPPLQGDYITCIASTFMRYGESVPYLNYCAVLNGCEPVPNAVIEQCETEVDVLLAWSRMLQRENPDFIIGYNIFGFDYEFMFRRSIELGCMDEFIKCSKNTETLCAEFNKFTMRHELKELTINIASGQYNLRYIDMDGRQQIDLFNYYRKTKNLPSYKLDYVAGELIGDDIKKVVEVANGMANGMGNEITIITNNLMGLTVDNFIHIKYVHNGNSQYIGEKYRVLSIDPVAKSFTVKKQVNIDTNKKYRWGLAKDDVTHKDIFALAKGSNADRATLAKYCIQDCNLVQYLFKKSDIVTECVEMSNIFMVPIDYIVIRGQGIKLQSLLSHECRHQNILMPVLDKVEGDDGYEGAIVLDPKCNLYMEIPIPCNDYSSLYPSCSISENIASNTKTGIKEYDLDGKCIKSWCTAFNELSHRKYVEIEYDTYKYVRKTPKAKAVKVKSGKRICRFIQPIDDTTDVGIIPAVLKKLLQQRKATRAKGKKETDEFMKNVLEQRQLAYKVAANSIYGGCGAPTSTFYDKDVAACITATGRKLLTYSSKIIVECYGNGVICDTKCMGPLKTFAECIYGDTDSVFYALHLTTLDGVPIKGQQALQPTIEIAQQVGETASMFLKPPHDFEYEKTFMPFFLLSKKRYVGMLYELDVNRCKRKEMGIALKRRDSAPIMKYIYGAIIDILLDQQKLDVAIQFLQNELKKLVNGQCDFNQLILSKALNGFYKHPDRICHNVLANRIALRDPGNKPMVGDRVPYVFIYNKNKKALQGDKIESPSYVIEKGLKIDYAHYITNQIMKPVQQIFEFIVELLFEFAPPLVKSRFERDLKKCKTQQAVDKLRADTVYTILFEPYVIEINNKLNGNQKINSFFTKK